MKIFYDTVFYLLIAIAFVGLCISIFLTSCAIRHVQEEIVIIKTILVSKDIAPPAILNRD